MEIAVAVVLQLFTLGSYAPINVMPHYHIHGLRWGKVSICTLGKYKSQLTGAAVLV